MSRQTERADARNAAKVYRAELRQPGSYPASIHVPFQTKGRVYPFSSKRQDAKYARLAAA